MADTFSLALLSPSLQASLKHFCQVAHQAVGDDLQAVVLYGDLVRGHATEGSPTEVLLILADTSVQTLDKLTEPIRQGNQQIQLSVMIASPEDLRTSTDVFPIKFLEMQSYHHLLWGQDILSEIKIGREHLRLRCEQEFKNLMLRLRRIYVLRSQQPEGLAFALKSNVSSTLRTLSTLIQLKTGQEPPANTINMLETAARVLDLNTAALQKMLELKQSQQAVDLPAIKALFGDFMQTVETLAYLADRLEG